MTASITTADRDAIALAAIDRLPKIERRVLALVYGLVIDGNDGRCRALEAARDELRMSDTRFELKYQTALGKVAACLDVGAVEAGRVLFRIGTLQSRGLLLPGRPAAYPKPVYVNLPKQPPIE